MVKSTQEKTVRIHPFHFFQKTISKTMFSHCVEPTCPLEFIGWSITFMKSAYLWTGCMVLWQQILQASSFCHYTEMISGPVGKWNSTYQADDQIIHTVVYRKSHRKNNLNQWKKNCCQSAFNSGNFLPSKTVYIHDQWTIIVDLLWK